MRIFTTTITDSFTILKSQTILQWSVSAQTSDAAFTITGSASIPIMNSERGSIPIAIGVAGTGAYNSEIAPTNSPWDGVVITVSAGSVALIMTQD